MSATATTARVSYGEYLEQERVASTKHEFYAGVIVAMAGGTLEHSALASNVTRLLGNHLLTHPCQVLTSDARVRVVATGLSAYPDVSVVCGEYERAPDDPDAVTNPGVIVEVLSDSTETYDRGAKFAHYRRLPSLREYVLVSQRERRIEVYTRGEGRRWNYDEATDGQSVTLASVGFELSVDAVYHRVVLPAASRSP